MPEALLRDRLGFIGIGKNEIAALQRVAPVVDEALPGALDAFYQKIASIPSVAALFGSPTAIQGARGRLASHWRRITTGQFDVDYQQAVHQVGRVHARIGLEPRWYIGGYAQLLASLIEKVVERRRPRRWLGLPFAWLGFRTPKVDVATEICALVKASMLDMDIGITVYLDAEKEARLKSETASLRAERELIATTFGRAMQALANGDSLHTLPSDLPDDYRQMVEDYNTAIAQMVIARDKSVALEAASARHADDQRAAVDAIGVALARVADGDLALSIDAPFADDFEQLRHDFNMTVTKLHDVIAVLVTNVGGLRTGTTEIAQAADDLAKRTEQQAATLEQTTATLGQIVAMVRSTAEGAANAGQVFRQARADADQSGLVVKEAITAMTEIERSAQQISQIIGVIDDIAFQTNLLALNAGVEAARAGDAGRGFAVVASEVRALAQRSAEAAKEIKTLISTSTRQVGRGVDLVGQTGRALDRIVMQVVEISAVMTEISASAQEQSKGLSEVNVAIGQIDQVTQQNASMVEQSTTATLVLAQETEALATMTAQFRVRQSQPETKQAAPAPARSGARARPRSPLRVVGGTRQAPAEADWEEF